MKHRISIAVLAIVTAALALAACGSNTTPEVPAGLTIQSPFAG